MKPSVPCDFLVRKDKFYAARIDGSGVHRCHIAPNVYTGTFEPDVIVKALTEL
jgi:hypothetical protein